MSVYGILMSEDKVDEILSQSGGVCLSCGAVEYEPIEPDAVNYVCSECGEREVIGMETAIVGGYILPSKEKYPMLGKYIKEDSSEK